jgi:hypothetical protein
VPQNLPKTYILLATGIKLPPKQKAREEKEKRRNKKEALNVIFIPIFRKSANAKIMV